jgi:ribosomal protein S18 acetylase RimI-like enzyme
MTDMDGCISDFSACRPEALWALFQRVYASAEGMAETLAEKYPDRAAFEAKLAAQLAAGGVAMAFVDAQDKLPMAYAMIVPRGPARLRHTADLSMGVAPAARGKGLGRQVLQAALERARRLSGIEIVYLMVRSDNAAAIALYEQAGFVRTALLEDDTRVGMAYFDGVLMRMDIRV